MGNYGAWHDNQAVGRDDLHSLAVPLEGVEGHGRGIPAPWLILASAMSHSGCG